MTVFAEDDTTVLENDTVLVFFSGSFVGVFEPMGIGSVALSAQAVSVDFLKGVSIDNVTFGRPSEVSQPDTLLLLGVGLLGFVVFWRVSRRTLEQALQKPSTIRQSRFVFRRCASAGRRVGAKWEQSLSQRDGVGAKWEQKTRRG